MSSTFDPHGINDVTVAVCHEMTPRRGRRHADVDTIFLGGPPPSHADETELARFGLRKNYQMIFASFDPSNPHDGPCGFHAVMTDGLKQALAIPDGRLWKRDRQSPAVLLFPALHTVVKINCKGRVIFKDMVGDYHESGYELARKAVLARAARKPGKAPVVAPIGALMTVLDIDALATTFEQAE
ncbi:hypothetical protein C8J46_108148 [Sphingomonas sp. PP-F2F-A104-K0414]|uniref:hypothetical protein n=1 Tax=Sphingomonas sp. PP-F2F-A104-K0414 TaxID=2135661 RepID=UPI001051CF8F|nr:hypothetical protein [Sphingomonas sp. PP-F2F-A104-K0414]TCP96770.1 hypothetical protein C8J46_108148 [Sphingomonas sp. PP-F2F-A104-K0414]